eukprot:SAG11_NODE_7038_length_1204_cov_1.752941_2_plen_160_part_00
MGAQQRLALAVAMFASGSRLKYRGFVRESGSNRGELLRGLAAVLSSDGSVDQLYEVVAGYRGQQTAPPHTAVGMMPRLAPLDVAARAAQWAWQAKEEARLARLPSKARAKQVRRMLHLARVERGRREAAEAAVAAAEAAGEAAERELAAGFSAISVAHY